MCLRMGVHDEPHRDERNQMKIEQRENKHGTEERVMNTKEADSVHERKQKT